MLTSTFRDPGTGRTFRFQHEEGIPKEELLELAQERITEGLNKRGNVVTRNLGIGVDNFQKYAFGSSLEGIGRTFGLETIEQFGADFVEDQERETQDRLMFAPPSEGVVDYITELAAQSAPVSAAGIAGSVAGAKTGATIGAALGGLPGAALGGTIGGFVGGAGAVLPFFYGANRERQKEAIERGYRVEIDEGAAALTAIPEAALDSIFSKFVGSNIGKAFVPRAIAKGGGIFTRVAKGTARGVVTETPTEFGQQVLERYQSGLPMDSEEAVQEYIAAAAGGAVLGGLFGGGSASLQRTINPESINPESEIEEQEQDTDTVEDAQERINALEDETKDPVAEEKEFIVEYTDPETNAKIVTPIVANSFEDARNIVVAETGANGNTVAIVPNPETEASEDTLEETVEEDISNEPDEELIITEEPEEVADPIEEPTEGQTTDPVESPVEDTAPDPIEEPTPEPTPELEEERIPEPSEGYEDEPDFEDEPAPEPKPKLEVRQEVKDFLKVPGAKARLRVDPKTRKPIRVDRFDPNPQDGDAATDDEINENFSDTQLSTALEVVINQIGLPTTTQRNKARNLMRRIDAKRREDKYVPTTADKDIEKLAPRGERIKTEQDVKNIVLGFVSIAEKLGVRIDIKYRAAPDGSNARWNPNKNSIQVDIKKTFNRITQGLDARRTGTGSNFLESVMREELIHAAMDVVLKDKYANVDNFYASLGRDLTDAQKESLNDLYGIESSPSYKTKEEKNIGYGAEYARAVVQQYLYGNVSEAFGESGKALNKVKRLIRSVQRFITKALKTELPGNREAATIIAMTADLVRKVDPSARLTNQKAVELAEFIERTEQPTGDFNYAQDEPDPEAFFANQDTKGDTEFTEDTELTEEQIEKEVEGEHGATVKPNIDTDRFVASSASPRPTQPANAPIITRASLAGKKLFAFFSDRTRVGKYTGLDPQSGIDIDLQGGPMYPFMGNNLERGAGWAFTIDRMFSGMLKRVKATDGIGLVTLYAKENLRGNLTFLRAYTQEIQYAIKKGAITRKRFLEVANELRKAAVKSKMNTPESFNKSFVTIKDFETALSESTFDLRNTMFFGYDPKKAGENKGVKISSDQLVKEGFPNITKMVDLFAEPSFEGLEYGTIVSAIQFDQNQNSPSTSQDLGVDEHFSYKVVIKGEGLGFFSDPIQVTNVVERAYEGQTDRNLKRRVEVRKPDIEFTEERVMPGSAVPPVTAETVAESGKPPSKRKVKKNPKEDITTFDKYFRTVSSLLRIIHPRLALLSDRFFKRIDSKVLDYMTVSAPFFKKFKKIKNKKDKARLKQLIMYSPTLGNDEEIKSLRLRERDLLLKKYGMYNDYHLRVRRILTNIYKELVAKGYDPNKLEEYFPRRVLDLKKVKAAYGNEVKKSFRKFIDQLNTVTAVRMYVEARKKGNRPSLSRTDLANEIYKELSDRSIKNEDPSIALDIDTIKELLALDQGVQLTIGDKKTIELESLLFDTFMRRGLHNKFGKGLGNLKQRTIDEIPTKLLDAYADPGDAFESYVYSMTQTMETDRLIGRRFTVNEAGNKAERGSDLARTLRELENAGEITEEETNNAYNIFQVMLTPGARESRGLSGLRAFSYFTLLVEFTSTLSQVYDLPFVVARAGIDNTLLALFSKKIGVDTLGIDSKRISEEFRDPMFMDKAVRLGLKVTGFTRMDQFMKETNITANFMRFKKIAKAAANSPNGKKFRAEMVYMGFNDAEIVQLKAALQDGDSNNPLVRLALFSRLSETQPTTKARMPLKQSEDPNVRLLYTMKTFLVNQLNLTNDLYIKQMKEGAKNKDAKQFSDGFLGLSKLLVFMAMIGMPIDALKDFIAGRLGYLPDYAFNNTVRLFGISKYSSYKIQSEGFGSFALNFFMPVSVQQFIDVTKAAQDAIGGTPVGKTKLPTLMPLSDVLNRIFGFTKQREQREYKRRIREGDRPFLVPPGSL